jgi:salicylate hydroxylase
VAQVNDHPDIELRLGTAFKDVANDEAEVVVGCGEGSSYRQEHAAALIGADGIWSSVRRQLFPDIKPGFSGRIAWRGIVEIERVHADPAPRRVQLWMGANAHLVIYPVTGGRQLNVVAITSGQWREPGWSAPAEAGEVLAQFMAPQWSETARAIVQAVPQWRKWALFTLPQQIEWTSGPTALLGDAAHAMLPFAAQGAGMAIEDAAVLASCLDGRSTDIPAALRRYADLRQARVKRVQQTAEQNGRIYHLSGPFAAARNLAMRAMGGPRLLARQNWIYDWRE